MPQGNVPDAVSLLDDLVFDTGAGPWIAEVRPNLFYHWVEKDAESFRIDGGALPTCE